MINGFDGIPERAFDFYLGLSADNSRTFWQANADVFERDVRAPFDALVAGLAQGVDGDVRIFRPNRDVRFSHDKSPYKTNRAALVSVGEGIGFHVSLDADGVGLGGGFHSPDRAVVARYRAAVDGPSGAGLAALVDGLAKDGFEIGGRQVATRPRGVPADHPRLELMRREQLTAVRRHEPEETTQAGFLAVARADWDALRPLVGWLAGALA